MPFDRFAGQTPDEKRPPRDVEFGSYAWSAGRYIIVCTTNRISAIIALTYLMTARTLARADKVIE